MKGIFKKPLKSFRKAVTTVESPVSRAAVSLPSNPTSDCQNVVESPNTGIAKSRMAEDEGSSVVTSGTTEKKLVISTRSENSQTEGSTIVHDNLPTDEDSRKLVEASLELDKTLQLYFDTVKGNPKADFHSYLVQIVPNTSSGGISPERLTSLMQAVVSHKTQVKTLSTKVSQTFGKIYPLANFVLNLGMAAGEAFQPAKGVAASLAILLDYVENERSRSEDLLQQLQKIAYQCSRIAELQKTITSGEWNHLVIQKSTQLLTAVVVFFKNSIIYFNRSFLHNLGKSMLETPRSRKENQEALDKAIAEYDQALLLQIAISTISTRPKVAPLINEKEKSADLSELLPWLNSSYWETEAQFVSACDRRSVDSSHWILELDIFRSWRARKSRGLWLSGAPGFGKSVLAAYLTQLLKAEDPDAIVLFFFCRAANSKLNTAESIIRTLATQLMMMNNGTATHFRSLKEEMFESQDVSLLFRRLLHEPLFKLTGTAKYIIIDGIDELLAHTESAIVAGTNLYRFLDLIQKEDVQCIITSRPISVPMDQFPSFLHHRLTNENSEDISRFIAKNISQSLILQRGFDRLRKSQPEVLVAERAQGNFLWVATVLGLLDRNSLSTRAFEQLLTNVPDVLSQTYNDILDKLEQSGDLELTKVLLGCVLFNWSSLTIESLQAAVHTLYGEVFGLRDFVESECGSILTIMSLHEGKDIVQVGHETFKSFITDSNASGPRCLSARKCNIQLALACLETLVTTYDDKFQPFKEYATLHWVNHFARFQMLDVSTDRDSDPALVQMLFLRLHRFLTVDDLFCEWLKEGLFLGDIPANIQLKYFCYVLYDMQEAVTKWVKSPEVTQLCSDSADATKTDETLLAATNWSRSIAAKGNTDLQTFISRALARTWLNTNWQESSLAHWAFLQAKKTAQILLWDRDKYQPDDQKQVQKGGLVRAITHTDFSSTTMGDMEKLADLGGFVPTVGVQAGNYAFGCIHAKHPTCARFFITALDEHPDWWHLSSGLGDWYYRNNDKVRAVEAVERGMRLDPKSPPTAANAYWTARSELCLERGDIEGAIETLREAENASSEQGAFKYWVRMATIWGDQQKWENVKGIYRDALKKRTFGRDEWWVGLAQAYGECRDWKGELETLLSALRDNPANTARFANNIYKLAVELTESSLFAPAIEVLETATQKADETRRTKYQTLLARIYLGARQWLKAAELYESLLENETNDTQKRIQLLNGLGNAYLAMGDDSLNKATAAFEDACNLESTPPSLPHTVSLAYMMAGRFADAVRILKKCITKAHSNHGEGGANAIEAGMLMELQLYLGQCYHAMDRHEDGDEAFDGGIKAFDRFKEDHISKFRLLNSDDVETPIWRSNARPLMVYGELLEQLGRGAEAVPYYEVAEKIISKTRFVGDDDILEWEHQDSVQALQRARKTGVTTSTAITTNQHNNKTGWEKLLDLKICTAYRSEWYSYMASEMPRYRGGEGSWAATILKAEAVKDASSHVG